MGKLAGISVLVVEDDPDLREIISEEISIHGAKVKTADGSKMAMQLIRVEYFDFVLSDLRMPNGDGRCLAEELCLHKAKQAKSGVEVGLESGHAQINKRPLFFLYSGENPLAQDEADRLQIAKIFPKPFNTKEMIEIVLDLLNTG